MSDMWIPFSKPFRAPGELGYLDEVLDSGHTHGDGPFTARASRRLEELTGARHALLTGSGTHALELASWLLEIGPGDEVVVPSFTFSTTAASVVSTGATPVFVDVDPTTGSMDVDAFAAAVTPRTRAVYVVHYGGVAPDMTRVAEIAAAAGIAVVEDNAHGLGARWDGRGLGTFGVLAAQSFHATKNVQCGEGGALLVNDPALRGEVDKYSWIDRGSSYLPSELTAAVLTAQLDAFDTIQSARHAIWDSYADGLGDWAQQVGATLMRPPARSAHPAHVFWLLAPTAEDRDALLAHLRAAGVGATFHYIPLHSSVAGRRFGRTSGSCAATDDFAARLVRLPLWAGMSAEQVERVQDAVLAFRPVTV
jgi:dTDP-4-amino-4,6-dideoxygalactose transaminase